MAGLPKATKRRDLIKRFRELGWTGPHKGGMGDHPDYMAKPGTNKVFKLPNPHSRDNETSKGKLKFFLEQAGITLEEWIG